MDKRMFRAMLPIDFALLSAAGISIPAFEALKTLGVSGEEIYSIGITVIAVLVYLVRAKVAELMTALDSMRDVKLKQIRLASRVGLKWDPDTEDYVKSDSGGSLIALETQPPSWDRR